MKKTIIIEKGNQYDKDGYSIENGTIDGFGSISNNARGYTTEGNALSVIHNDADVYAAIKATLADGQLREITQDDGVKIESIPESHTCPKCGTYCDGDCETY